ncbi:MAG: hypothetical protein ACPG21_00940 [Crocinitomicaceae bacterium]
MISSYLYPKVNKTAKLSDQISFIRYNKLQLKLSFFLTRGISIIVLVVVLLACGASFGERLTYGNLSVYYAPRNVGIEYAQGIGEYFQENDLIQDNAHAVQLTSDENGFILRMVLSDEFNELPDHQEYNLNLLEKAIQASVFDGLNFRIEVCNANFVPVVSS